MNGISRRSFVSRICRGGLRTGMVGGLLLGAHSSFFKGGLPRPVEERAKGILRPPGALDEEEFLAACTRCTLCADACETQCIRFFGAWEGRHAGTPYIQADHKACNLCLLCTRVCPCGALEPLQERTEVRMGLAVVDPQLCVAIIRTGACGACHTICPLKNRAITLGILNAPAVHSEHCVGCGLCEEVCILDDRRAIRVFTGRAFT